MMTIPKNTEVAADKRADKHSLTAAALFIALSWIVLSHSTHIDNMKSGLSLPWADPWLTQFTSHIAILLVVPLIPFLLTRVPLALGQWYRQVPIYIIGFFLFGGVHIILMDLFRTLSFPPLLGRPYYEDLLDSSLWLYELPKDFYSYLLILSVFITGRHVEQLRLEAESARTEAKTTGRLTLKSGGRILFIQAGDIIHAQAASNYLEIETATGRHLVRMTLTALERLIAEAGETHIRVHRSHLLKRDAIREIAPSTDGRLILSLTNGKTVPVGRKYKEALTQP